jgi:ribonucleoside-diphosphate reductase beta chain
VSRNLFIPRDVFKPFEYPECEKFAQAINHSYWLVEEWNFLQDIHEFNNVLLPGEQRMVKHSMLAISQVEVAIKLFWGQLYNRLQKPEIALVGTTFSESEVRHEVAYSKLLELLGLNDSFNSLMEVPCIKGRYEYLKKYKSYLSQDDDKNFLKALILFSSFIENVSLFSQFFILSSFKKKQNRLKDIASVVTATSKEESIHFEFGAYLINTIKQECPHLWDKGMEKSIINFSQKAYEAECKVIDWIVPNDVFIKRGLVKDFLKDRFNQSLTKIGIDPLFDVRNKSEFKWYYEELSATMDNDFFDGRPSNYALKNKPITSEDLF